MTSTIVVWFMVLRMGTGGAVIPEPFVSEAKCRAEAAKISRPAAHGGLPNTFAYCIPIEKAVK